MSFINNWILIVMALMATRQQSQSWMLLRPCVDNVLSAALPHPAGFHRPPHPLWVTTQHSGGQPGKCTAFHFTTVFWLSCQNRNEWPWDESISGKMSSCLFRVNLDLRKTGPLALVNAAPVMLQFDQQCWQKQEKAICVVFSPLGWEASLVAPTRCLTMLTSGSMAVGKLANYTQSSPIVLAVVFPMCCHGSLFRGG